MEKLAGRKSTFQKGLNKGIGGFTPNPANLKKGRKTPNIFKRPWKNLGKTPWKKGVRKKGYWERQKGVKKVGKLIGPPRGTPRVNKKVEKLGEEIQPRDVTRVKWELGVTPLPLKVEKRCLS